MHPGMLSGHHLLPLLSILSDHGLGRGGESGHAPTTGAPPHCSGATAAPCHKALASVASTAPRVGPQGPRRYRGAAPLGVTRKGGSLLASGGGSILASA